MIPTLRMSIFPLLALGLLSPSSSDASRADALPPASAAQWQERTRAGLEAFADAARNTYILAVYPDPTAWRRRLAADFADANAKVPLVRDLAGYQAVMRYFATTFHDSHVGIRFTSPAPDVRWPGFLLKFDSGVYRVTASKINGVRDGDTVSSCDGDPTAKLVGTVAKYEVGLPMALETTRMAAALRLFVDRGSPLRARPSRCVIAGRPVTLMWKPANMAALGPVIAGLNGVHAHEVGTRLVGDDGAWVTLGYFKPETSAQAKAFRRAIDEAPSLRHKKFIILDVRGNPGGPYGWFMAYLRALYGPAYADHYATARLRIRAVHRVFAEQEASADDAENAELRDPADPPYEQHSAADDAEQKRATAAGEPFFKVEPPSVRVAGSPPPSPVTAKVYVLTDYGCASACIGFVDELKLFPGVRQIGLPTFVDSRTGTAEDVELPGGDAVAWFATMTRDGRVRDDNVAQRPSARFDGDMRDERAVEAWLLKTVATPVSRAARHTDG